MSTAEKQLTWRPPILSILGWLWVVLAGLFGLVFMIGGSFAAGLMALLSAAAALPPLWRKIEGQGLFVPVSARLVAGIAVFLIAPFLIKAPAPVEAVSEPTAVIAKTIQREEVAEDRQEFDLTAAKRACEPEIKRRLAHPSTADFAWFSGTTFKADGSNATFAVRFTAKNTFGLEVGMVGACTFRDSDLTDVYVGEDMD